MEIIPLHNKNSLAKALTVLRRGGVLVYPTETAYALGCDATNRAAVKKIFAIKGRDPSRPLPCIVGTRGMAQQYMKGDAHIDELSHKWWPGPLTIVSKARRHLPVCASDGTVAIRLSAHDFARTLSQRLGVPIVSTSANPSGGATRYSMKRVISDFKSFSIIDLAVDAGRLPRRRPSTIVQIKNKRITVVRQGSIRV